MGVGGVQLRYIMKQNSYIVGARIIDNKFNYGVDNGANGCLRYRSCAFKGKKVIEFRVLLGTLAGR